ncbi:MAG: 30S ribosomal protein S8 [Candidatus Glassbacteria bacterium RBG_16_58_8]|uniref:Small ribosomal subunit protein uS8 n=1 Tax=Candidatus Glassbacteria bacterium RBG_16_58_8 TaxID=1817866 RepID=A0A1F5Y9Z3_9BACT|nr:MAG: 30S ribosomal protein S8 [Candidatus Glassbacteria bacterium RBG_16_58_8]
MTMTDPIADLIVRIRNAGMAKHRSVEIPYSKVKAEILRVLKEKKMISDYRVMTETFPLMIRVLLKFSKDEVPVIKGMKRVSKPGLRIYSGKKEIPMVRQGLGFAIVSTPQGMMTDYECRKAGVGGEVLALVW